MINCALGKVPNSHRWINQPGWIMDARTEWFKISTRKRLITENNVLGTKEQEVVFIYIMYYKNLTPQLVYILQNAQYSAI
jgi:hypothetical protein